VGRIATFWRRVKEFLFEEPTVASGKLVEAQGSTERTIDDGLSYALPIMGALTETQRNAFNFTFDSPNKATDETIPKIEDPLAEWSFSVREDVLRVCHGVYHRNPIAKRGITYTASFVVGGGMNIISRNTDVREVIDEFMEEECNAVREYERQAVIDLLVDGELFLHMQPYESTLRILPLRPWECLGIKTAMGDPREPKAYYFMKAESAGDVPGADSRSVAKEYDADSIVHVAINRHGYELRGRPELYPVLPWLKVHKEWLEDRARQNQRRGSLLWHVKVNSVGAAPGTVATVMGRWNRPPTPGSVYVSTDRETIEPLENNINADSAAEDGRQLKLMAAVGLGLPEYFLADGENANLASSKSQQLPALMTFSDIQRLLTEKLWYIVLRRVVENAIADGRIPEEVEEQSIDGKSLGKKIKAVKAFDISYPPIGDKEPLSLAQALQIAAMSGWVSQETASTAMGYDYELEKQRIERETVEANAKMKAGLVSAAAIAGMTPTDLNPADNPDAGPNGRPSNSERAPGTGKGEKKDVEKQNTSG
jgi:hypothetical protein